MRGLAAVGALCVLAAFSAGCAYRAPVVPPVGILYSDYDAPLTIEPGEQYVAPKSGRATSKSILWLFSWGDCSLRAAAEDGDLTTISYADHSYLNVLGFYQKFTVIAHGQ